MIRQNLSKLLFFGVCGVAILVGIFFIVWGLEKNKKPVTESDNNIKKEVFNPASLDWILATSSANWESRDSFAAEVFNGKIWMTGGLDANANVLAPNVVEYWKAKYFGDLWSTQDGINWTLINDNVPWGKRRSAQMVIFQGKMWLAGGWGPNIGLKNDVWYTEDGTNWKLATSSASWPAREGHQIIVFNDKMWLMGGVDYDTRKTKNDVWYSSDGINWAQATSSVQWSPRWDHSVVVFKDKMWLMGGMDLNDKIFNDVWYSSDGINWTQATSSAPWETRQGFGSIVYQNRLWVIGKFNDAINGGPNNVWYSDDGFNWQKTDKDPAWTGREDITALFFNDKLWIFGGMDSRWQWVNDVWYSTSTSI